MKIAYVIDKLALHGTQKMLVTLGQQLAPRHYEQRVYCLKNDVHPLHQAAFATCGVPVRVVAPLPLGFGQLVAEWRRWQPDLVVTLLFYSDLVGRIGARLAGIPVIITLLRSSVAARQQHKPRALLWLDRITARWVTTWVVNSTSAMTTLIRQGRIPPEHVTYIPNSIASHAERRHPGILSLPKDCRHTDGTSVISENTFVIGTVGRLHRDKGCDVLLRAFQRVHKRYADSVLLFIGSGELLDQLSALARELGIAEQVRFLGQRPDVSTLLDGLDVYVQTSIWEGMSNALMEAMAQGLPVVATAVGGTPDLIDDGATGWLIEPENIDMLVEKLIYVSEHRSEAERAGRAAAERMAREFSVERMAQAYDVLFRAAVSTRKKD